MKIYNTLDAQEGGVRLRSSPGEIRMYVCGVTVYDLSHIGHARSAIVFDVIRRYLAFAGYRVTIRQELHGRRRPDHPARPGRRRAGAPRSPSATSDEYRADMEALGVLTPDVEPKATDHVPQMISLIERLLAARGGVRGRR